MTSTDRKHPVFVVTGMPGSGKSTIMKQFERGLIIGAARCTSTDRLAADFMMDDRFNTVLKELTGHTAKTKEERRALADHLALKPADWDWVDNIVHDAVMEKLERILWSPTAHVIETALPDLLVRRLPVTAVFYIEADLTVCESRLIKRGWSITRTLAFLQRVTNNLNNARNTPVPFIQVENREPGSILSAVMALRKAVFDMAHQELAPMFDITVWSELEEYKGDD